MSITNEQLIANLEAEIIELMEGLGINPSLSKLIDIRIQQIQERIAEYKRYPPQETKRRDAFGVPWD